MYLLVSHSVKSEAMESVFFDIAKVYRDAPYRFSDEALVLLYDSYMKWEVQRYYGMDILYFVSEGKLIHVVNALKQEVERILQRKQYMIRNSNL